MGLFDIFKKKQNIEEKKEVQTSNLETNTIDREFKVDSNLITSINVLDNNNYILFKTNGLKEKYNVEISFKLNKNNISDIENEITCSCNNLNSIVKLVEQKNQMFEAEQYVYTGKKQGIDAKGNTKITGFITVLDENKECITFIGAMDNELLDIINEKITVNELYSKIGTDITDYNRNSVL